MVYLYHVIFGVYGFWLPNDPRGSWSDWVGSWELFRFGPATKVTSRRSHAWDKHDVKSRLAAKLALKYPAVHLTGKQARSVGTGFARIAQLSGYVIHACSFLPQHVHLIIARHHYKVEQIVRRLKQAASIELERDGLHPFLDYRKPDGSLPTPWAGRCWKCYIDNDEYARSAIAYVERNPKNEGKPVQTWNCVTPYEGLNPRGFPSHG